MLPAVLAAHGGGIDTRCRARIGCRHVRRLGWLLASILSSHAGVCLAPKLLPVDLSAADVRIRLEQVKRQMVRLMLLLEQVYLLLFLRAELGLLQTKKREKECVSDIEDAAWGGLDGQGRRATYQSPQVVLRRDIFQYALVEEPKHLPALEKLEQALLVFLVARALLEDEADHELQLLLKVLDVVALHVLHDVVHYV